MNIKICGVTNYDDAKYCYDCGAWALGFNFCTQSPRYIAMPCAKKIIQALPKAILKIGIYINASYDKLLHDVEAIGLDLVQVYAPLDNAPNSFKQRAILSLQATTINDLPKASVLTAYRHILLDAPKKNLNELPGGTGRHANWALARTLVNDYSLILAGGLKPANVKEATQFVNPYAIDLASGIEKAPGIKDAQQINQLFKESER